MKQPNAQDAARWPSLPFAEWSDTLATLQRWFQIVGKVRLTQTPWINHCWHVTLYVSTSGLTTSPIPHGERSFAIDLDFAQHRLVISASDGQSGGFALAPMSVATFYRRLMSELERLALPVAIFAQPNELADTTPFAEDEVRCAYDAEYANRFWRVLMHSSRVLQAFRARFVGKCSPVHFFWGAADLCVTRFSGRAAPPHPGGIPNLPDWITREAYSQEVASCGFWPGGGAIPYPAFYAYAYPEPAGFATADVEPAQAFYSADFHEFVLPYDAVRESNDPEATLLAFLESTYVAAANLAGWNRAALERGEDPRTLASARTA